MAIPVADIAKPAMAALADPSASSTLITLSTFSGFEEMTVAKIANSPVGLPRQVVAHLTSRDSKRSQPMLRARYSILLAGTFALFSATQTVGDTLCRPTLTFEHVGLSETQGRQRLWSAVVAVDASQCATTSGRFYVNFVRLKEMTPDLLFSEEFTWTPGRIEISVDVWLDEAVLDHWIGYVALCPCRP